MVQIIEYDDSRRSTLKRDSAANDVGGLQALGSVSRGRRRRAVVYGDRAGRWPPRTLRRYGAQIMTQFTTRFLINVERSDDSALTERPP